MFSESLNHIINDLPFLVYCDVSSVHIVIFILSMVQDIRGNCVVQQQTRCT
jgi:hypothetical protein